MVVVSRVGRRRVLRRLRLLLVPGVLALDDRASAECE